MCRPLRNLFNFKFVYNRLSFLHKLLSIIMIAHIFFHILLCFRSILLNLTFWIFNQLILIYWSYWICNFLMQDGTDILYTYMPHIITHNEQKLALFFIIICINCSYWAVLFKCKCISPTDHTLASISVRFGQPNVQLAT